MNLIRGDNRVRLHADLYEHIPMMESFDTDPLNGILQKEMEKESLTEILPILPEKARSVMQALAIQDSLPEEIADCLQLAKSNVYKIISRSRVKANEERFRLELDRYLTKRRKAFMTKRKKLALPGFSRPYSLLSVCVHEVLRYAKEHEWTLTDIMGISGDAFRLNVAERCSWRGISTFDWSYAGYQTMERLGWQVRCFGRPGGSTVSPEQQVQLLKMMHLSIDQGLPAIVWNLSINEFALVYGYDDESRTILCRSFSHVEAPFSYDQLGRNSEEPGIFVAALEKRVTAPASDHSIIRAMVRQVKGEDPPVSGFAFGLEGYRLWAESVQNGKLDLLGHAYQVAILSESRHHAVQYLDRLADRARTKEMRVRLTNSTRCYRRVTDALRSMYPSFPFGYGGSSGSLDRIAEGLQAAWEAEKEGVRYLECALTD